MMEALAEVEGLCTSGKRSEELTRTRVNCWIWAWSFVGLEMKEISNMVSYSDMIL
jgi:hypothetical protein